MSKPAVSKSRVRAQYADEDEDERHGCILAHAMGLGKSIQTIALLHTYHGYFPGHLSLLIVPANVLGNWKEEFKKWLPPAGRESQQLIIERVGTLDHIFSMRCCVQLWHEVVAIHRYPQVEIAVLRWRCD